jgi:hypothetical protein
MTKIKIIKITDAKPSANELARFAEVRRKSTISQVTEPLKEEILKGNVHTIEEMRAWLKPFGYSDAINDAAINFILREFVMSKVSCDEMSNMDMIVELLRPQLEVTKEDIEPVIIMGLYHHRNLIGSPSAFIKADNDRLL